MTFEATRQSLIVSVGNPPDTYYFISWIGLLAVLAVLGVVLAVLFRRFGQ